MTFSEEFSTQWESLKNFLVSRMIESNDKTGKIDYEEINRLLENEKKRWSVAGQYNKIWLDNLRAAAPDVADELVAELSAFRIAPVETQKLTPKSYALAAGPAVGGAAIGFIVTKLLESAAIVNIIGTVGLGVVGVGMGANLMKQKQHDAVDVTRDAYNKQLEAEGDKLLQIVKKAD